MKLIVLLLILFNSFYANGQHIIQRLDPELSNGYQTSGLLPGGGKRIIISSRTSLKKPGDLSYGMDWTKTKGEIEVWQANPSPLGYKLPYSAYDIASIIFPSGDMILQSNNRDCNHNWYSDMMMVSSDRSITWRLGRYQADYEVISNSPGMVDRNTVAFISPQFDTVYVDLDGNEKTITGIPIIYTHMLIHPNRYFGFSAGRWVALDSNFQEINSIPIDNFVWAGDLGQYHLLESDQRLYYLDDNLQILASSDQFLGVYAASQIGSRLAVLSFPYYYLLDSLLQPLIQFPAAPREQMTDIITHGDSVYVLSTYNGINHFDLVVRQYIVNDTLPTATYDISLESISLADTIPVGQHDPPGGNSQFYFDTISFQIRNNTADTVWNCRVELDWASNIFCCTYQHAWTIENMALAPNETKQFAIDSFVMDAPSCGFHSPFCFWIESPNNEPDINPTDNYLCQPAKLVTGETVIPADSDFKLTPNPADQWVYLPSGFYNDVYIFGLDGSLIKRIPDLKDTQIYIGDLPGGIYFLRCSDHQKHSRIRKLVVLHKP